MNMVFIRIVDISQSDISDTCPYDLEVRPLPFDNAEEDQDGGEEVEILKVDKNGCSVVEVVHHLDQIYEVPHPRRIIIAEHKDLLETASARMTLTTSVHWACSRQISRSRRTAWTSRKCSMAPPTAIRRFS